LTITPHDNELLYRKAQGKKIQNSHEKKIRKIFPENYEKIEKLELTETDEILKKIKSLRSETILSKEFHSLTECLSYFSSELYHKEFYAFIDEDWKYYGAIKLPEATIINPQFDFDESISDELRFFASDFSTQISIDYSFHGKTKLYECTISATYVRSGTSTLMKVKSYGDL